MHLDGLWDIWWAAVLFFWTLQKSTAATAAAYINTVMFFSVAFVFFH
jgi:hypothetical protein